MEQSVLVNLGLLSPVANAVEDVGVKHIVADVVRRATPGALPVVAAMVVAVWSLDLSFQSVCH